jgi:hypothetical protein
MGAGPGKNLPFNRQLNHKGKTKMETLDLKKQLKFLYQPSAKVVEVVDVPCFHYLSIDGQIEAGHMPGDSPNFAESTQAIYSAAYTLKFALKQRKEAPIDFPVMALEGLWWTETGAYDLQKADGWKYTLLILQPEQITQEMFAEAVVKINKKKTNPALARLRLAEFSEGRCIQIMHIGPYADEARTLQKMDEYAAAHGLRLHGKHHEIYLGDPRKAQPEKMKTVLRHPIEG